MSMLSSQADELRLMARLMRDYDYKEISRMLREAADTIDGLTAERDALKEQINRFDVPKSDEIAENGTSKGVLNIFDVQNDTREKLEADVREWIDIATYKAFAPERMREVMLHWLDRQAAITTAECTAEDESCCEACRLAQKRKIAELTAERDALKEQINRFDVPKSDEIAENGTSKGVINNFDVQNDSREKLEDDLEKLRKQWKEYDGNFMHIYSYVAYSQIVELLDRQAAITERELCGRCSPYATAKDYLDTIDGLTAERDQLSRDLDAEHALVVQFEYDNAKANDTINTLRASVAGLKDTVEKLSAQ